MESRERCKLNRWSAGPANKSDVNKATRYKVKARQSKVKDKAKDTGYKAKTNDLGFKVKAMAKAKNLGVNTKARPDITHYTAN